MQSRTYNKFYKRNKNETRNQTYTGGVSKTLKKTINEDELSCVDNEYYCEHTTVHSKRWDIMCDKKVSNTYPG
jgi:hypothetical protein